MTTKENILASALKVISKYGTKGASMSEIAKEAGITKSSLYYYFNTKEEMINEMYHTFRNKSKIAINTLNLAPKEIIKESFKNYLALCNKIEMKQIFSIIESEKMTSSIARELYLEETHRMIENSQNLFKRFFPNVDSQIGQLYALYAHELIILVILNDDKYTTDYALKLIDSFLDKYVLGVTENECSR